MDFRTDFEIIGEDVICLLALKTAAGDTTAALARRHAFETEDPADDSRVVRWQDTQTGARLPDGAEPYAYWVVALPDPSTGGDSYG